MNKPAWEQFADAEKYDSNYDGIEIPYEREDTPEDKLNRIYYLERRGMKVALLDWELEDLDRLYFEMFGTHLSEDKKKLYS